MELPRHEECRARNARPLRFLAHVCCSSCIRICRRRSAGCWAGEKPIDRSWPIDRTFARRARPLTGGGARLVDVRHTQLRLLPGGYLNALLEGWAACGACRGIEYRYRCRTVQHSSNPCLARILPYRHAGCRSAHVETEERCHALLQHHRPGQSRGPLLHPAARAFRPRRGAGARRSGRRSTSSCTRRARRARPLPCWRCAIC